MIRFYLLLMIRIGCCAEDYKSETKTVAVGENVTLICPREISKLQQATWYWIRLVSGNSPEFLGVTFHFKHDGLSKTPHIKVKQEEGTFLLQIYGASQNDSGLYYCVKVKTLDMIFMTGTFLKIKGPDADLSLMVQEPSSGPISPGDPVTLRCSVLSDSEKKTCSADHRVFWFKAGSDESHPNLIYAHGNAGEECELSLEADSVKKCFYNSKIISPSDTGTYYCAVATCGQILFGNGIKHGVEEANTMQNWVNPVAFLISPIMAIILIAIAFLLYVNMERKSNCCNAAVANQEDSETWSNLLGAEDKQVYTAAIFTVINANIGNSRTEKFYAAVKRGFLISDASHCQ